MSGETKSLAEALAAFQAELPHVAKSETADAGTYSYSYADLAGVSRVALPLLAKHGLSFSAKPTLDEGRFVLSYVLRHVGGDEDRGTYPLPSGNSQQVGSAITYARRYALMSVTGIAPDDDDGVAAKDIRVQSERYWDPTEQQMLVDGWTTDINNAESDEAIAELGKAILSAKRNGTLSPTSYEHLAKRGAARKAELNGAAS